MISYTDALACLIAETSCLDTERVGPGAIFGRFLASDLISPLALPGFDNAAMDGYALRVDTDAVPAGASFAVAGMHAAGERIDAYPGAEACEIATGARMPAGFNTVVPVERSERVGDRVRFPADERRGQNVRHAGDDIVAGALALRAGRRMDAAAVMLVAALGVDTVEVVRRPRVAVIATGSELNTTGPLPPGGIHDSNGPFLAASLEHWGTEGLARTRVPDTGDAFHQAVQAALAAQADLIVTTGAVSAGRFDFVPAALAALGARVLFHKVAIRPGKPVLAARFDNGPLVLSLPGNPMAVAVGYRFFVAPVLRAMAGLPMERPVSMRLAVAAEGRPGLLYFGLGKHSVGADGQQVVTPLPSPGAYRMVPYTQADTWLAASDGTPGHADAWPLDPADAT